MVFVTDRTAQDVAYLESLNAKGWHNMTDAERAFWLSGSPEPLECLDGSLACLDGPLAAGSGVVRGAYNAADLNRVEGNAAALAALLGGHGYHIALTVKTDWADGMRAGQADILTRAEMARYLGNIKRLAEGYYTLQTTPALPESMEKLTYRGANAIERAQADLLTVMGRMAAGFRRCGTLNSGQGVILP